MPVPMFVFYQGLLRLIFSLDIKFLTRVFRTDSMRRSGEAATNSDPSGLPDNFSMERHIGTGFVKDGSDF